MSEFLRGFCSHENCRAYTVHVRNQPWEAPECVHKHKEDEIKEWDKTRESFRMWLADLYYAELLEVAEEVKDRLAVEEIRIKAQNERSAG